MRMVDQESKREGRGGGGGGERKGELLLVGRIMYQP